MEYEIIGVRCVFMGFATGNISKPNFEAGPGLAVARLLGLDPKV